MDTKRVGSGSVGATDAFRTAQVDRPASDTKTTPAAAGLIDPNVDVAVSPRARELAEARKKATEIAKATPDVRSERVDALRKKIQSGEYKVQPEKIADGMLQEAARDELSLMMHEEAKKR